MPQPKRPTTQSAHSRRVSGTTRAQRDIGPRSSSPIEHVILLVLENRSFDHLFGDAYPFPIGLRGAKPGDIAPNLVGTPPNLRAVLPTVHADYSMPREDPGHSPEHVHEQVSPRFTGSGQDRPNTGFGESYRRFRHGQPEDVVNVFRSGSFPALAALAGAYRLCTGWYSSVPGPTWPNRYFLLCGSSAPKGAKSALTEDSSAWTKLRYELVHGLHFETTVFDWVTGAGKTWGVYEDGPGSHARSLAIDKRRFWKLDRLFAQLDASDGDLPNLCYVEPAWFNLHPAGIGWRSNDMHPGGADPRRADALVARVYNALRASRFWSKSLFVVVFDEHGGLYDHVPPPATVPPTATPSDRPALVDFRQLGVRVPCLFVSPWVAAGTDPTTYDHTSMLPIIGETLGLGDLPSEFGARAAQANSFANGGRRLLPQPRPVSDCPTSIPEVAGDSRVVVRPETPLSDYQRSLTQLMVVQDLATPRGGRGLRTSREGRLSPIEVENAAVDMVLERAEAIVTAGDLEQYLHESGRTGSSLAAGAVGFEPLSRSSLVRPRSELAYESTRPGDIVFFHGSGVVSKLIRLFDRSDYNHVAMVKDASTLVQADWPGIGSVGFAQAVEGSEYVLVRRLARAPVTMTPVLAQAEQFIETMDRYSYEQIVLLAFLSLTRAIPLPPVAKTVLRGLLDQAAAVVNRMVANGREPLICSEFCYRCYDQAVGGNAEDYKIRIDQARELSGTGSKHPPLTLLDGLERTREATRFAPLSRFLPEVGMTDPRAAHANLAADLELYETSLRESGSTFAVANLASDPALAAAAEGFLLSLVHPGIPASAIPAEKVRSAYQTVRAVIPDFVTPGDLRRSASLVDVGMMHHSDEPRSWGTVVVTPATAQLAGGSQPSSPIRRRAVLVGINAYPGAPLRGCVNDVKQMSELLVSRFGFASEDIRILTDARATTEGIKARLGWLLNGLRAGDQVLFHFSGHGTQVATRNPQGEVDGLDEVICPVDFDWTDAHLIRDKEFQQMFSSVPAGVSFIWVSDSCHSQDLSRGLRRDAGLSIDRSFPMTADMEWRIRTALGRNLDPLGMSRAGATNNVALLSACRSDQTACDAVFANQPGGAFTHFLVEALLGGDGASVALTTLVGRVQASLRAASFSQEPQVEGSEELVGRGFLA